MSESGERERHDAGKTMGDFALAVLQPKNAIVAFLFIVLTAGSVSVMWVLVPRFFGAAQTSVQIGDFKGEVLFESKTGEETSYLTVVHPQGWQDTGVQVDAGDVLSFHAGGKVHVDIFQLWEQAHGRAAFEADWEARGHKRNSTDESQLPEEALKRALGGPDGTSDTKVATALTGTSLRWVGPDGRDPSVTPAWTARAKRYQMDPTAAAPDGAPRAALIGRIWLDQSNHSKPFKISCKLEDFPAPITGTLQLAVNEPDDGLPGSPMLFFSDNLGFFWVKVKKVPPSSIDRMLGHHPTPLWPDDDDCPPKSPGSAAR